MPIVTIDSLPPTDLSVIPRMIAEVRDDGAQVLQCPPSNVWVMFRAVPLGYYVQGELPARHPQEKTHPPVVTIRAQSGRTSAERDAFVAAVAAAVGRGLSIPPRNVWIHYQEMRPQDVWFEGGWAG